MRGGMAQSVEHIVHIDGVVGSSPTVTTKAEAVENQRLLLFIPSPWGARPRGVLRRYEQLEEHVLSTLSGWLSCRKIGVA